MNKHFKIVLELMLLLFNCFAFWDVIYQSEEALKLEYSLIAVSILYVFSKAYLKFTSK
tara:strand:- start:308 stop:481 length:174 start_codon:yes stop_codon:yes gene_type:complete